jgi:hypothetical protein
MPLPISIRPNSDGVIITLLHSRRQESWRCNHYLWGGRNITKSRSPSNLSQYTWAPSEHKWCVTSLSQPDRSVVTWTRWNNLQSNKRCRNLSSSFGTRKKPSVCRIVTSQEMRFILVLVCPRDTFPTFSLVCFFSFYLFSFPLVSFLSLFLLYFLFPFFLPFPTQNRKLINSDVRGNDW